MYSYGDQIELLKPIRVKDGETRRIDCPFCGGRNTFTLSNVDGKRVWNCYKASCGIRGVASGERTLDGLRRKLNGGICDTNTRRRVELPRHTSNPRHHEDVMRYLQAVHSIEAFNEGLCTIRFSPADNRVLFYMNSGEGAMGRALDNRKPKWKAYGNTSGLLTVGEGDHAVVVEDAASACSVARLPNTTGAALLGTNMSAEQRRQLLGFSKITICLDADASAKAVKLKGKLEGLTLTRVRLIEQDMKYMTAEQIERVLS